MPTYQYRCTDCGEPLEVVQSFTDDPLTECPGCQGRLRKVFSSVGIVFKGSGFYRTDSRDSSPAASGAAATSGGGDAASTTEAKPTGTAEKKPDAPAASTASESSSTAKSSAA